MLSVKQEIPDMKSVALMRWKLLLLAMAAVPGCATHALWEDANLGTWHQPSPNSGLKLFHFRQPDELLVLYQESTPPHEARRTRAYLLYENEHRIEMHQHPKFVKIDSLAGLEPVPIFSATNSVASAPAPPLYAVLAANKLWFTVYSSGAVAGSYSLPEYWDGMGKMERIALTPLAVSADASIVGGGVACFAGFFYGLSRVRADIQWPTSTCGNDVGFSRPNQ